MNEYLIRKLNNGLTVILVNYQNFNSVYFDLAIKTGSRYEQGKNTGISHLAEHLLAKKAFNYLTKKKWLKHYFCNDFRAYSLADRTNFEFFSHYKDAESAIKFLKTIIKPAVITPKEFKLQKEIILEYQANPDWQWSKQIDKYFYKNQPLGHEVLGQAKELKKVTLNKLKKFLNQYYQPANMVLTIAGKINPDWLIKVIDDNLGYTAKQYPISFQDYKYPGDNFHLVDKNIPQTYFGFYYPVYNQSAIENLKWEFFIEILSNYLCQNLTDKISNYSLSIDSRPFSEFFSFGIEAIFQPDKTVQFYKLLHQELKGFLKNIKAKDLNYLKENKIKSLEIDLNYPKAQANLLGWNVLMFGDNQAIDLKKQAKLIKSLDFAFLKEYFDKLFKDTKGKVLIMGKFSREQKEELSKIWQGWKF